MVNCYPECYPELF